jgi:hypothetical protein
MCQVQGRGIGRTGWGGAVEGFSQARARAGRDEVHEVARLALARDERAGLVPVPDVSG